MKRKALEDLEKACQKMTRSTIDNDKKYDRQLRLWGDHGQESLEAAKVCVINACAVGTEILKNLILPGIGSFTIVDNDKVQEKDIGNNFFLSEECLGKSRAKTAVELLQELNTDVFGNFVDEDLCDIISTKPNFFKEFTVVVAVGLSESVRLELSSLLWHTGIPFLICSAYGMIGSIRLSVKEHTVMESHPDNAIEDLHLDKPFPQLVKFSDSLDLNMMSKMEHSHTPYVILLLKYLEKWKEEHAGNIPQNYKEKCSFKELLRQGLLVSENGIPEVEDNFEEATKAVNTSLNTTKLPKTVQEILSSSNCEITSSSSSFWMLCKALKEFVNETGSLPLRGSIPDMTADSKRFIALQNVYHEKAMEDKEKITLKLHRILSSAGKPTDFIKEDEIRLFCKNSAFLRVVQCKSLHEEYKSVPENLVSNLEDPDSDVSFYVLLRAVDKFYAKFNKYPGESDEDVESDCENLQACVTTLLQDWGIQTTIKEDYVKEMCRYGACELHPVAAFIGGAAAQEVIKLVTHQYVPFNDFFLYNAMTGSSVTLKF